MPQAVEIIKRRILIPIALLLALLLGGAVLGIYRQQQRDIDEDARSRLSAEQELFPEFLRAEAQFMAGQLDRLAEDQNLQDAWTAGDRDLLLARAGPLFRSLRSEYRVTHFYFIGPDKVCFLRVHNPGKHGDTVSRFTLDAAVREGAPGYGIELGKFGTFALRQVYPWHVRGELVGYLELGMEIEHLTPRLRSILGIELIVAIDKQHLSRLGWEEGLRMMGRTGDWDEFRDHVVIDRTLAEVPEGVGTYLAVSHQGHGELRFRLPVGDRVYRGLGSALTDAGHRELGHLVVLMDVTAREASVRRLIALLAVSATVLGAGLYVSFSLFVGRVQRRLVAAADRLKAEVAERKQAQEALQEAHDVLEQRVEERAAEIRRANETLRFTQYAIDHCADAAFWVARDARFTYVNGAACRSLGYSREELLRMAVPDIDPDLPLSVWPDHWRRLQERGSLTIESVHRRKNGTTFPVDITFSHVEFEGNGYHCAFARDITHRRQAEERQQMAEAQLLQNQKLQSIGTLAGGVAHEINNPINGIMNYAQLVLDKLGPDSPVAEYAGEIIAESERVARIVHNLLTFSRHEKEEHSPAKVADLIEATLSLVRAVISHDQITLEVEVSGDLPKVRCRSQQIQQVLMNLVTNARDALNARYPGHDQDKILRVSAGRLDRDGVPWVRVTVEDHGAGIPVGVQKRLFEPFFTTKGRARASGLGLSVSHGIAQDHGGELSVESEPGKYTRFHLDLPGEREE